MSKLLDNLRVTQMFVGENGRLRFCVKFSADGTVLEGGSRDMLLMERLQNLAVSQPRISGEASEKLQLGEKEYTVEIKRYIDCTAAELPGILESVYGDREAVDDPAAGRRFTYKELSSMSCALAKSLIRAGIRPGEHVAVIMNNCWEQIVAKFALMKTGAVADNISYHETAEKLRDQLFIDDCTAVILKQNVRDRKLMKAIAAIAPESLQQKPGSICLKELPKLKMLIAVGTEEPDPAFLDFAELIERGRELEDSLLEERKAELSPLCPASIIHTSGSTGKPKSVLLNNAQILENALSHQDALKLTQNDRLCMTSPMFHAFGAVGSMLTALMSGACLICYSKSAGVPLIDVLADEKATVLCAVPVIHIRLCNEIRSGQARRIPDSIRLCVTAGAPCPPELVEDMKNTIGARDVMGMYGMTETSPGLTSHSIGDPIEVICNTVGHFWEGVEYKIIDPESGEQQKPFVPGEICVRGYMVMQEYYKNPVSTAKLIDSEGWVHTGDLGYLREDGNLRLQGRIKELIIRGAENISPLEVELCLRANPMVEDAAVTGAPDPEYGEQVCAFILPRPGEKAEAEELKRWCHGRIATIKIPQKITFLKEFPVLPTGKVDKKALRKMFPVPESSEVTGNAAEGIR